MTEPPASPPPAWYPDPEGSTSLRWWDGATWTSHLSSPPTAQGRSSPAVQAELRALPITRIAIWAVGLGGIALASINVAYSSYFRALFHWFRITSELGGTLIAPPAPKDPGLHASLAYLGAVFAFGAEVIFLVWQYRATTTARQLGYPAAIRPGWGIFVWFIPLINLFLPYIAIRDTLRSGDQSRRIIAWFWLGLVASNYLGLAAWVVAPFYLAPGVLLLCLSVAGGVLYLFMAPRAIQAIADDHRAAATGGKPGTATP